MSSSWRILGLLLFLEYPSRFAFQPVGSSKLNELRAQFDSDEVKSATGGVAIKAYILPNTDAHLNNWVAEHESRVKFLTGFKGSNAKLVVTNDKAHFWTNSKFIKMAKNVLDPSFTIMNECEPDTISVEEFLIDNLAAGDWVGIDPSLHCIESAQKLIKRLKVMGIHVAPIRQNLVDKIWKERPAHQLKGAIVLSQEEHGRDAKDKIKELREKITKKKCNSILLSALDEIMWLLNIRGFDIEHNPLAYSYALVTPNEVHLFMDKADENVKTHLQSIPVTLHNYDEAYEFVSKWNKDQIQNDKDKHKVFIPSYTNYHFGSLFDNISVVCESPVKTMKSVKNRIELEGMRNANIRDSVAMVEYLSDLEDKMLTGQKLQDPQAETNLHEMRSKVEKFMDESFKTKAAFGANSAEIRYYGDKPGHVTSGDVFLIDSGAHYRDGTSSVARTIWVTSANSAVPDEFIKHNTLVLKSHINLANSVFPRHTSGIRLDTLARQPLWQAGLDYKHRSGHGVGHFLKVHESPDIGPLYEKEPGSWLKEGMTVTINPGYYNEGKWGIRIKNTYEVANETVPSGEHFLGFEALTLVPIQTNLIDKTALTDKEVEWLNTYHDRVLDVVGGRLQQANKAKELEWLKKQCAHI